MDDKEISYNDFFKRLDNNEKSKFTAGRLKTYDYNSDLGKSDYDKNLNADVQINEADFYNSLSSNRADIQPISHKLGSALIRLTNIIPEAVGSVASALDFEDYFNQDDEVGNWLTDITEQWKQSTNEALPIYRQNPGKSLDFGDSGWWIENGSALFNSIGGFAIGGGVITKGLTGLSKLTKAKKLAEVMLTANKAEKVNRGAQTVITAGMLNQSEAILESMSVYDDIYKETLLKLNKEKPASPDLPGQLEENEAAARQKAADAASATVMANRANILLNITSANMFLKAPKLSNNLLKKETFRTSAKTGLIEGVQESAEESINFLAGEYGRAVGRDQEYGVKEILNDLGKPEAIEAALLGFIGGMGQTIVTKEGVNRVQKTVDPITGEKMSVKEYNNQAYNKQKDIIDENEANAKKSQVKSFTNSFNNVAENLKILDAVKKAEAEGNAEEVKRLKDLHLDNTAYYNFQNGTTESLIKLYEELRDGEQKEDMPKDYKELANKAITKIKTLENFYNESGKYNNHQQVYINRSNRYNLENYIDEVGVEVSKVSNNLNGFISKISELSTGVKSDTNIGGYFLDINNIEFNPAKEAGDTKAANELEELKTVIKNSGDYKSLLELKEAKVKLAKELKDNIIENSLITSKEYQQAFKERVDSVRQTAEENIDKQVKNVEKEIKNDEVIKNEADRQAEIAAKNAETEQAIADKKAEVAETTENLNNLADNFNVGETTDLENIFGEKYKGVSGEILSVEENADGTRTIMAQLDNNDIISSDDKVEPNFKNDNIEDVYNTDGSVEENTSNEESVKKADDIADTKEAEKDGKKLSDVKLMSTYRDSGKTLKGIPQAYIDYEREPINKVGTKVYFEINKSIGAGLDKSGNFKKASKLYNDFINDTELSAEDKNFMVDYLPFKAKINNSDTVYTFLESKPNTTNPKSLEAYNNRTRPLKISLINHLKNGSDINSLYTTVKGQYGGSIQLDTKGSENSVLDLDGINSLEDVELYVIDQYGQLKDISGEHAKDWTKTKKNWKGSIYMKTKWANGNPFYLNLNFGKVSTKQAEIIFEVYRSLLQKGNRPTSLISNLAPNIQSLIKKNLKKEIDLITKTENKPFNEIIISELLDLIFWDGSKTTMSGDKNVKSRLRINYETKSVEFGDKSYKLNELGDDKKAEFVDWVSKNKNRNFKFKPKPSDINQALNSTGIDYLEYAIAEKVINTNAKVNQPLFEGFTNLYLTNSIGGETAVPKPKVVQKQVSQIDKKSEIAKIEADRQAELKNNLEKADDFNIKKGQLLYTLASDGSVAYTYKVKAFNVKNRNGSPELKGVLFTDVETNEEFWWNESAKYNWRDTGYVNKVPTNSINAKYDAKIAALNKDFSNKSENKSENIRISQNFIVPLQENPLSDEAKTIEDKPLREKRVKLSKKEAQARALAAANKLRDGCNGAGK
jgi:hypothetical protein